MGRHEEGHVGAAGRVWGGLREVGHGVRRESVGWGAGDTKWAVESNVLNRVFGAKVGALFSPLFAVSRRFSPLLAVFRRFPPFCVAAFRRSAKKTLHFGAKKKRVRWAQGADEVSGRRRFAHGEPGGRKWAQGGHGPDWDKPGQPERAAWASWEKLGDAHWCARGAPEGPEESRWEFGDRTPTVVWE